MVGKHKGIYGINWVVFVRAVDGIPVGYDWQPAKQNDLNVMSHSKLLRRRLWWEKTFGDGLFKRTFPFNPTDFPRRCLSPRSHYIYVDCPGFITPQHGFGHYDACDNCAGLYHSLVPHRTKFLVSF